MLKPIWQAEAALHHGERRSEILNFSGREENKTNESAAADGWHLDESIMCKIRK